jgi:hypothetical protein
MNWKPGDVAIIVENTHTLKMVGRICTVVAVHYDERVMINHRLNHAERWAIAVEIEIPGMRPNKPFLGMAVKPEWLRRFDGNDLTSWDDCAFKPKSLKRRAKPPHHINCRSSFKPIDMNKLENLKWP